MANFINTLVIEPQETGEATAQAMAVAFAKAVKWTLDDDGHSVWKPGTNMRIYFYCNNNHIGCVPLNKLTFNVNSNGIRWYGSTSYCVDYVTTGNSVAVGCRIYGGSVSLCTLIAENTAGASVGVQTYSSALYLVYSNANDATNAPFVHTTASGVSTSLVKYPDVWSGCMFKDLYMVISCPSVATDMVFYIGGRYFRYMGNNLVGFALPVTE